MTPSPRVRPESIFPLRTWLPAITTFDTSTKNYTLYSSGTIGISAGSLTKSGTGTLTITNTNSYTGETTLCGGTINVNNAAHWVTARRRAHLQRVWRHAQLGATSPSAAHNYVLNANARSTPTVYDLTP